MSYIVMSRKFSGKVSSIGTESHPALTQKKTAIMAANALVDIASTPNFSSRG